MEPTNAASLYQIGVRSTSLIPAAPSSSTLPRWATARSASVTDPGDPTASTTNGKPPISIWCRLQPTTREPLRAASCSQCALPGSLITTLSAPQAVAASAWCGWRASTVTGQFGNSPRSAARDANPMIPAPTISTGSPSTGMARSRPWQAMETGS